MTDIDWSKAPEGAEFYEPPYQRGVWGAFIKTVPNGSGWKWWNGGEWQCHLGMTDKRRSTLIERPISTEWTGTGLPPVGAAVEAKCTAKTKARDWFPAEVKYISPYTVVLVDYSTDELDGEFVAHPATLILQPRRTPEQIAEQIAAEERKAAIDEMAALSPLLDKGWSKRVCAALYDAGYRKTEGTNHE